MDPVLASLGPIPKKRGRPPKSASNSTSTKDSQQKITSLFYAAPKSTTPAPSTTTTTTTTTTAITPRTPTSTVSTTTSTPKKRGRPPKNTTIKEQGSVASMKKKEIPKAKKGKDSTKKISDDSEAQIESEEDSEDSDEEFNPENTDEGDEGDEGDEDEDHEGHSARTTGQNKHHHEDLNANNELEQTSAPSNSNDSADTDENKAASKKRGRRSKAELAELAKQGKAPTKKTGYIKKGQPGYVKPKNNYVRKTPAPNNQVPVVEEESPLFSSEFVILPEWMPPAQLSIEKDDGYLPKSQGISFKWENSQDIHLDLFQVCLHDIHGAGTEYENTTIVDATTPSPLSSTGKCNSAVLNVGGPVWNIDWCPVPQDQGDEYHYMAIGSYVRDSTHALGHIYRDKNIIQIWRVGNLTEDGLDLSQQLPTFCFGIAHEGEAAVCLKWCPLGGFAKAEKNTDRLGLLAVSFFDGSFKIYSVPHPNIIEKQNKGRPLVLRLSPVFEHNSPTQQLTQQLGERTEEIECGTCTRDLSWSIDNDWAFLLTGDDEGTLSVWNLSKFAGHPSTNTTALPILSLNAHRRRITSVAWSPLCKHQFLSCGQDGFIKFWDLRDPFHPLFSYLIGGAWLQCLEYPTTKLPFLLFGMDDHSLRLMDLKEVVTSVNKWHFGPIWGVSTNLYNCMLATCSSDGSVKCCSLNEKSAKKRRGPTVTQLIEQLYFNPETNLITFSSTPATATIIPATIPVTITNGDKSTPKKPPKKKKKQEEEEEDSTGEPAKKQKKQKKDTPQKEEETGIYVFPHEKLQVNQVKWNPRACSNSWLAFCGNTGLVCIKLVKSSE